MAFHFKIRLLNVISPPVWRRVVVPEHFTFWRFHLVIQEAFGWWNSHLFQFSPEGLDSEPAIGLVGDWNEDDNPLDCERIRLNRVFYKQGQTFVYLYDFGDGWEHSIDLQEITKEKIKRADLLKGEGRCPPEDCGGYHGYQELKNILADPRHSEHGDMKEWLGLSKRQKWNPDTFDFKKARAAVQKV